MTGGDGGGGAAGDGAAALSNPGSGKVGQPPYKQHQLPMSGAFVSSGRRPAGIKDSLIRFIAEEEILNEMTASLCQQV